MFNLPVDKRDKVHFHRFSVYANKTDTLGIHKNTEKSLRRQYQDFPYIVDTKSQ